MASATGCQLGSVRGFGFSAVLSLTGSATWILGASWHMNWTHPSQGFLAPAGVGRVRWRFPEHHWSDAGRRPLVPRCTQMAPVGSSRHHHPPDTRPPPALRGGRARGSQSPSSFQRLPSSQAPGASPPPCQCVTAAPPTQPPSFSSPAMPSGAPSVPGALLGCRLSSQRARPALPAVSQGSGVCLESLCRPHVAAWVWPTGFKSSRGSATGGAPGPLQPPCPVTAGGTARGPQGGPA